MKTVVEHELLQSAARFGVPDFRIGAWCHSEAGQKLHVFFADKLRVLDVSDEFLADEPDENDLKKVIRATDLLVKGDTPRVPLRWSLEP